MAIYAFSHIRVDLFSIFLLVFYMHDITIQCFLALMFCIISFKVWKCTWAGVALLKVQRSFCGPALCDLPKGIKEAFSGAETVLGYDRSEAVLPFSRTWAGFELGGEEPDGVQHGQRWSPTAGDKPSNNLDFPTLKAFWINTEYQVKIIES